MCVCVLMWPPLTVIMFALRMHLSGWEWAREGVRFFFASKYHDRLFVCAVALFSSLHWPVCRPSPDGFCRRGSRVSIAKRGPVTYAIMRGDAVFTSSVTFGSKSRWVF